MNFVPLLILVILIGFLIYQLLPHSACLLVMRLSDSRINLSRQYKLPLVLPARWQEKITRYLERAGFTSPKAMTFYLCFMIMIIPLFLIFGFCIGQPLTQAILPGLVCICSINSWFSKRISRRKKAFATALYKIYRFLNLQLTAGVKITDSLKELSDAVQDSAVRPVLVRFAARYELTLDFDQAFQEIRDNFDGSDCELMATQIRQCLQTGDAGKTLQRMEELMFARYFSIMQADSQKIRFHLLLAALLGIMPAAVLFMFPLLYQAVTAMQSVFG